MASAHHVEDAFSSLNKEIVQWAVNISWEIVSLSNYLFLETKANRINSKTAKNLNTVTPSPTRLRRIQLFAKHKVVLVIHGLWYLSTHSKDAKPTLGVHHPPSKH